MKHNSEVVLGVLLDGGKINIGNACFVLTDKHEFCVLDEEKLVLFKMEARIDEFINLCEKMERVEHNDDEKQEVTYH